ncbi:Putative FAD-binding 8, ferric reductase, NAD binding domain-containing protein [Colletotrichum destructivum]|uniref:FAD-binding 8, ferric reductase, NAD binding domain-containing protein n=1 Tax=Colletotrichum destructivum TaxID=34406 RepID=A0AAX4J5I0_9PEZI|nr:Putative FAD-binding 8, ferric reductase, NAD binding domain-containing protein [Colletotrichum destructivum]
MQNSEHRLIIVYAVSALSLPVFFICLRFRSWLSRLGSIVRIPILRYLVYPTLCAQWSLADVLASIAYLALNILCLWFQCPSLSDAGRRAADLALVNMVFQYVAWHLDSLTNLLGLGWRSICRLHGLVGIMTLLLLIFHSIVAQMSSKPFPLDVSDNRGAVLAASAIGVLVLLSIPAFKDNFYEVFMRLHQGLAILSIYGIWEHLALQPPLARLCLYVLIGASALSLLFLSCLVVHRNGLLGHGFPRTSINNSGDVIILKLSLSRPVLIDAGQSISLWVLTPSARLRSLWQTHPFVVVSWSDSPLDTLDLLVEPRLGLTQKFLQFSKSQKAQKTCLALFSGPHGTSIPVTDYDVVLMVASGYGIAAQLPYLKKLIYEFNSRKARTRRIHLVWKLGTIELAVAVKDLLDGALMEDTLDDGYILKISIYIEHISQSHDISPRATIVKGTPDFDAILRTEVEGKYIRRVQEKEKRREDMLVLGKSALQLTHASSNSHSVGIG